MLLPEVMLALWTTLCLYAYLKKKWVQFTIFSILLVLTKETGIVLVGTLFLDKLIIENLLLRDKSGSQRLRELLILAIPVAVFSAFMIMQKIRSGWFLFPEHIGMMYLNPHELISRLGSILVKLLFNQGRNIFFIVSMICFAFLLLRKHISKPDAHRLLLMLIFIIGHTAFCSANFFTLRYLLCVIPLVIITGTWFINTAIKRNILKIPTFIALAALFTFNAFIGSQGEHDVSPGYKNSVLIQKQAVNYAEQMNWHKKPVYSAFLMQYYMTIPKLGYLTNPEIPFYNVWNNRESDYDIYIFCSNENDPMYSSFKENRELVLIKRFQKNKAWMELYEKR